LIVTQSMVRLRRYDEKTTKVGREIPTRVAWCVQGTTSCGACDMAYDELLFRASTFPPRNTCYALQRVLKTCTINNNNNNNNK